MPDEHVEIERKFDAGPDFALPDLTAVAGVSSVEAAEEQQLEATYHDTPDLRLLRSRITLRRRTGGADAGWHVKLPGAAGARRELHQPLGRATKSPPKAVLGPVLGVLGTHQPGPVATVATRRVVHRLLAEDGRVLAEVADDTVLGTALPVGPGDTATVTSWREIEVELVDGDESLFAPVAGELLVAGARESRSASKVGQVLADRLAAVDGQARSALPTGGTPGGKATKKSVKKAAKNGATAGNVVLAAVAGQVAALREADLAFRTGGPEGVHDLRVACRRLRSIFAAFRTVLDRERTDPIRDELKWVGEELSGARDGEVALEHLRQLVAAQPPELVLGPVAARLQEAEVGDHEAGEKRGARSLSGRRYLQLLDTLDELLADPPVTERAGDKAAPVLADAVRRQGKRLRRAIDAAREADPGEDQEHALHEVRKAAKRVRYTAEVAVPVLGGPAGDLVDRMKDVQETLGAAQDTVVTRAYCTRLGRAAQAAGENPWTYGRLHALEEARAERAAQEFWAREPALAKAVRAVAKKS